MDDELLEKPVNYKINWIKVPSIKWDTLIADLAEGLGIAILGMETPLVNLSGGQRSKLILAKIVIGKTRYADLG